jgi:hypothetical protein
MEKRKHELEVQGISSFSAFITHELNRLLEQEKKKIRNRHPLFLRPPRKLLINFQANPNTLHGKNRTQSQAIKTLT